MGIIRYLLDHFVWVCLAITALFVGRQIQMRNAQQALGKKMLKKAIESNNGEPVTLHPLIDPALCIGCGACTTACPEGDILKLINHKAVLVSPTKCVGHGECERACPMDAISLVFGTKTRGMDIPRVTTNYESNIPGLYLTGEIGGMGLIRNAVRQGRAAAEHAIAKLNPGVKADYDAIVVGLGPAGFSAALKFHEKKMSYRAIDQNSFGGTIANFPRQKLVMSHPFDLPMVGPTKFKGNTASKEQIMDFWRSTRSQTGLKIYEGERFESVDTGQTPFKIKTSAGEFTAHKLVLAVGVRGSPRRLGVPGEDSAKVTYNLIDPEQYRGQNIVVVGGGNAGAEVAQMLAKKGLQNKVKLLVRGKAFDRCNDDNQARLQALKAKGQLEILFNSSIESITPKTVVIVQDGAKSEPPNDFVFVLAGAELPHKFLMSIGVKIDKKFEEGLSRA